MDLPAYKWIMGTFNTEHMDFRRFQHVERFGNDEVDGIDIGTVHVFPKIDGANASLWWTIDPHGMGCLHAGSRNRELSLDNDNQGFFNWCVQQPQAERIASFFRANPYKRLYGEWLVPHSLKTYREETWRRFYVFDVMDEEGDVPRYMPYEEYQPLMEEHGLEYIPPICIIENPTYERLVYQLTNNIFLIEDGRGVGEGVVLKNYNFLNRFGRTTWAKIVSSEFKEKHAKTMGAPEIKEQKLVEIEIANKYVTKALCEKTYHKIKAEAGWSSKYIPRLLSTVYHDLITEEAWQFVKEHKNPVIDFKKLNNLTINKVKEHLPNLF